jgi:histone deacetylase complex regulatory component SIN3|tara:strand:- start:1341 stop:1529 length:189 start_codon:yes stop_codon:yes gene_type:complete
MKTKNKKMTIEEEYRNADVPMPNDMLNSTNTEQFVKKAKEEYNGGKAYTEFLKLFFKGGRTD